jgi:hypothetical protein
LSQTDLLEEVKKEKFDATCQRAFGVELSRPPTGEKVTS